MEVTVDSVAAYRVSTADDQPTIPRENSEGSRSARVYLIAGQEQILNRGQKFTKNRTIGSVAAHGSIFHYVAERQPLAALCGMKDKGHLALFDKTGSYIIRG